MGKRTKVKNKKIVGILTAIIILVLIVLGANPETINTISKITGVNLSVEQNIVNNRNNNVSSQEAKNNIINGEQLIVDYIDVGQADSILLRTEDTAMLIDAGNNGDGKDVVQYIKDKGINNLEYVVGTHPHEDHIGGIDNVINEFDIGTIYMPNITTNTKTYEDVLTAIENKGLNIRAPKKGDKFNLGKAECEIMTDSILDKNNLNLASIVIKVTFGNNTFLFTGDAETQNEETINWPKVDVLKVGHHGSNTSSSEQFLNQMQPQISVISVGKDNDYGHPNSETIQKLEKIGSTIYRTDENGTIEIISDGTELNVITSK
mgnify:FL=1